MLKSEIYELEKFIGDVLNPEETRGKYRDSQKIAEQVRTVGSLVADLKEKWVRELFSTAKEHVIRRYVQYHQAGITQLSNQISRPLPSLSLPSDHKETVIRFYETISGELERLLHFLKHSCYSYFDKDYKVSVYYCRRQREKLIEFEQELKSYQGVSVERELVKAIAASVRDLISDALESGMSYRQVEHALNLRRMVHLSLNPMNGTTTDILVQALYRQNLNTLHFYNWYQAYFIRQLSGVQEKDDQQKLVTEQARIFSAIFVDPQKAFEPELASIDRQILTWLHTQLASSPDIRAMGHIKQNRNGQLPLNLSVPQFALFIRVFHEAGCFPLNNVSKVMRFFTQHFTTKKQLNISFKSFKNAFHGMNQSAAAMVRAYLQKMISYINKIYFPK